MIYVRVELWPGGRREHERFVVLAEAEIENVGGSRTSGNYRYRLFGKARRLMREGSVSGYKRIADHTWMLIRMIVLDAMKP